MEKLRIFEAVNIFSSRLAYYEVKVIQQKKKIINHDQLHENTIDFINLYILREYRRKEQKQKMNILLVNKLTFNWKMM